MNANLDQGDPIVCSPNDLDAASRSKMYALLTEAFSYPQGDVFVRMCNGDLLGELREAIEQSPLPIERTVTHDPLLKEVIGEELRATYSSLFDVTGGTPRVSLLERKYCADPEQQLWEKLLRFYKHFGLDFSKGYTQEQPDHLATELSFMHYLSFLQARMNPDYDSIGRGQVDFLSLHLIGLANGIAEHLSAVDQSTVYKALGGCLQAVVVADLDHMKTNFGANTIEAKHDD